MKKRILTTIKKYTQQYCFINIKFRNKSILKIITNKKNKHFMIKENDKEKRKSFFEHEIKAFL